MRISDVVTSTLSDINRMPRFDLTSPPIKPKWYLQIVTWLLSFPEVLVVRPVIRRHGMEGLKGPYILLCNHNSFLDFKVAVRALFPRRATFIVAIDGFINRESLMRNVGCFGKRKFASDPRILRQIKHSLEENRVICEIYPEARYSLVGTSSELPDSLGKMIKLLEFPVVTLISHGHHLRQPVWNLKKRKLRTSSDITWLLDRETIRRSSMEEINVRLKEAFSYDDYRYQLENGIIIDEPFRAENLHKPLYQCPRCGKEFEMQSRGARLWCGSCGSSWEMDELGRLAGEDGNTRFPHIPDWFEWQREQVRREMEEGRYKLDLEVEVDMLPNSSGFYRLGRGRVTHGPEGFHLTGDFAGERLDVKIPVSLSFGVHIEYDYFGKGDCFSFSTKEDTYYLFPVEKPFCVTKLHFAAEELYHYSRKE